MAISIKQMKAARALLGWSQERLSEESNVPLSTLKRIESADSNSLPDSKNAEKLEQALTQGKKEAVEFIAPNKNRGEGLRLKKAK